MKINILFALAILVLSKSITAQNLVPNGGFENIKNCPNSWVDIVQKPVALNWYSPDDGTPDYYNMCGTNAAKVPDLWSGYQNSSSGEGFAGIYNWSKFGYREYLAIELSEPLIKDTTYLVSFRFANAKNAEYACFDIGLQLSTDSILTSNSISVIDSKVDSNRWNSVSKWARISTTYIRNGTEKHLFIGNFSSKYNPDTIKFINNYVHPMINGKSYMYIDDVVIENLFKPIYPMDKPFSVENIYFEFDKSILKKSSFLELAKLINYLEENIDYTLTIIGHTDGRGTEEYNNQLSLERAKAVKTYLMTRNIKESRVATLGQGEYKKLKHGDSEEVRSKNRRVEFILSFNNN